MVVPEECHPDLRASRRHPPRVVEKTLSLQSTFTVAALSWPHSHIKARRAKIRSASVQTALEMVFICVPDPFVWCRRHGSQKEQNWQRIHESNELSGPVILPSAFAAFH